MRISPKLLLFEVLAFLVFAVVFAAGFVAWRLSQGPIDLALLKPQVERSLSEARGGQPVKLQSVQLEWVGSRGRVEAAARGLTALDAGGKVVFSAERAAISLDAGALLSGKFKTRGMRLENGAATVVRSKEGVWSLADVVVLREPASDKPFNPLKDLKWETIATPIRALVSAGSFEQVELSNFNLLVRDLKAGTNWSANPVGGVWSASREGVTLDLNMKLVGQAATSNSIGVALAADGEVSRATSRLTLEGVDPLLVARMFGYAGDDFSSGRPGNASFTMEASEKGGLQKTRLTMSDVTGRAKVAGVDVAISDLALDASYDPATRRVDLTSLKIASDRATGTFKGSADLTGMLTGAPTAVLPFRISGADFQLGLTPTFETTWPFASAEIVGTFAPAMSKVVFSSIRMQTGAMVAEAVGEAWFDGPPEARKLGVKMKATADGEITPQQIVAFWPVNLGQGGRNWVKTRVLAGKASKAVFVVDWPPGANDKGYLDNGVLTLDWQVSNSTVSFLQDFPPVTNVSGSGHLEGNRMSMVIAGGNLRSWQVDDGAVSIPRFHPKGETMEVAVNGRGDLREVMRVLDQSNLKVGSKYGLKIEDMTGSGGVEVLVQRPIADDLLNEGLRYTISGGIRGAGVPALVGDFGLSGADVRFEVTRDALSISGAGQFGPAPVVFDWKERFDRPGVDGGAELTARAKATPDLLNAFGFAARNVMQGEAEVELRASGPGGRDFSDITANVDLTHAALELSEFGWRKKYDAPAQGSFRYGKDAKGAVATGDIRADGLELVGEARLGANNQIVSADIERIFSRDSVDLRGGIIRRQDGGYAVTLSGPYFDASPWMDSLLSMNDSRAPAPAPEHPGAPAGPVFEVSLSADRVKLREAADMTQTKVTLSLDANGPRTGKITGRIDKEKMAEVTISTEGEMRKVSIRADDAGFAARVLLKLDYLEGGKLALDGTFGPKGGEALVTMSDVRLRDAPLMAQIFSLASLRGLADTLGGDGVLFTKVEAPVKIGGGRIDLPGLRASGPAMGLTARGWVSTSRKELSLDGVIVPSFGVNSLLGGIPIIGDLFVSRQGEGMFAPTYSVRGTFEKAQVSLNPIAAITPGVLRRIFENPEQAPPVADAQPAQPAPKQN